jgi:hypothetical protein
MVRRCQRTGRLNTEYNVFYRQVSVVSAGKWIIPIPGIGVLLVLWIFLDRSTAIVLRFIKDENKPLATADA